MEQLTQQIIELVLGLEGPLVYGAVAFLSWGEAAFLLGLITPGELTVAVGGMLASRGQLALGGVAAAAAVGTVLGNVTGYWLGRRWGADVRGWKPVERYLGRPLRSARALFRKRGEWAIVGGAFVSYVRMFVPFLAGDSRMPFRRFLAYCVPAGIAWAAGVAVLGFLLGESWRALQEAAGAAAFLVLVLFLLALVIRRVAVWIARRRDRLRALARWLSRTAPVRRSRRASDALLAWLRRRFEPRVARGLSLTLGFLTLLAGAAAVGIVLHQVEQVQGIARVDFPVLQWMSATRTPEAVLVARTGLRPFALPGLLALTALVVSAAWWRWGWKTAVRAGVGLLGSGLGARFLDEYVLHAVVPRSEFPSVPVAVAASLLVHATGVARARGRWGATVATAAVGLFLACTVALAALVAGWAAPSGVVLGFGLGLTWSTALELSTRVVRREGGGGGTGPPGRGG